MEIDWAPPVADKLAQIDARVTALRVLEASLRERLLADPAVGSDAATPPPSAAAPFAVLVAARTAIERLGATRAALARRG
ncbi:MAG: hypothetical protein HY294_10330 [Candidatus Rokubacteria bacterium]|nr:hypothetical protein [Candidatus Rokubacteria bacterium]MBI3826382.1 hypothetical protein [Candidatus Rokubacteria bacterium]